MSQYQKVYLNQEYKIKEVEYQKFTVIKNTPH